MHFPETIHHFCFLLGSFVVHTNFDQVTKMHDFSHWAKGVNIAVL